VTVEKTVLCRSEFSFRLKNHEVGIKILCDASLLRFRPGKPRRTFRHPARDIYQRESAALASDHITGSASERLEIPPQADRKFRSSIRFISGGQGE